MLSVCASISDMENVVHLHLSIIRWPTSSQVAVNPDEAAVPPTLMTLVCPDGRVDPAKAVPIVIFSMGISPTGVVPRSTRRVLSSSLYRIGMSAGAE